MRLIGVTADGAACSVAVAICSGRPWLQPRCSQRRFCVVNRRTGVASHAEGTPAEWHVAECKGGCLEIERVQLAQRPVRVGAVCCLPSAY